ncbi:MAG: GspH/FimT family protein [Pseudomonadota bacterium]
MKKRSGFTLIELMITLAVMTIVLTMGVPSFLQMMRNNHTVTQANQLVTSLNLARSEAVKRGMRVTVMKTGAEWENGWRIFSDLDGDSVLDDDGDAVLCELGEDCVLRIYPALSDNYTLRTGGNFTNWVAYLPTGQSKGDPFSNDTFRLCADDQDTAKGRSIAISLLGRITMNAGTTVCP